MNYKPSNSLPLCKVIIVFIKYKMLKDYRIGCGSYRDSGICGVPIILMISAVELDKKSHHRLMYDGLLYVTYFFFLRLDKRTF
jgi:hypothetical protein